LFEVRFSNQAEKAIKSCESKLKARLEELFERLTQNPVPAKEYDLRKIAGMEGTYRIRVSSFRVTYCIYWEQKIIRILKIGRRDESTYKKF
jgi:mRNA-degrading endonuclease RelE of RelBE toxin-antitoxin system